MTHVLLCAGTTLLVIDQDGTLFYRRPGQPDVKVPYAPQHHQVFLHSARFKYDLSRVIGLDGEQGPTIPEETSIPELRAEQLTTGETVYRIVATMPPPVGEEQNVQNTSGTIPVTPAKEILASP